MTSNGFDYLFQKFRVEFEAECAKNAEKVRRELVQILNQQLRRFRQYQNESEWVQITLDAAAPYANYVALFTVQQGQVRLRGQKPREVFVAGLTFSLNSAAAIKGAVDTGEPMTALRTVSEVSGALSEGHSEERAHILPITNSERVGAVLFASDAGVDLNALELVTGIASSVLERKPKTELHAQISPLAAAQMARVAPKKLPPWAELPPEERQLHIRAQRFARVAVAELQLARPEACRAGREQGDLYLFLKREIDKNRESYRKQFMTIPSMVDYLHLELIQTAAQGDEQKLGVDYPGRLV